MPADENKLPEKRLAEATKPIFAALLFFSLAFLILFLRRPDALLNAQFWAEDGKYWFSNAYNLGGINSLFLPQDGYFQTLSRLTALFSQAFPLSKAPLIFNIIAISIQTIPALLLVSSRFKKQIPQLPIRIILALIYLLLPNTAEIQSNITNAHWFLAIAAFFIIIADQNQKPFWKIADTTILILAGLSGPFAIFLFPIAFLTWYFRREKGNLRNLILISGTATIQVLSILFLYHGHRFAALPAYSTRYLLATLNRQVFWGALIGSTGYLWILNNFPWYFPFFAISTCLSLAFLIYASFKGPLSLKLFLLFGGTIFIAGLLSPTGNFTPGTVLIILSRSTDGIRYWLIPMTAFLATIFWGLSKNNHYLVRIYATILISTLIFGLILDFEHPPLPDYHYAEQINLFQNSLPGQLSSIPINPPGWEMNLTRQN